MFFYEIIQKKETRSEISKDMVITFSGRQDDSGALRKLLGVGRSLQRSRQSIRTNVPCMHPVHSRLALRDVKDVLFDIVARHYFIEFLGRKASAVKMVQKWIEIQNRKVFANSRSLHDFLQSSSQLQFSHEECRTASGLAGSQTGIQRQLLRSSRRAKRPEQLRDVAGDSRSAVAGAGDSRSRRGSKQARSNRCCHSSYYEEFVDASSSGTVDSRRRRSSRTDEARPRPRPHSEVLGERAPPPCSCCSSRPLSASRKKRNRAPAAVITDETLETIVETVLQHRYFDGFLMSSHFWRYVMEVVSSSRLKLSDVLLSETLLGYFAEFAEEEDRMELLQCWLTMETYRRVYCSLSLENASESRNALMMQDAAVIFNRYFTDGPKSMSFSGNVKRFVRQSLALADGSSDQAFVLPQIIAYRTLDEYFLKFLVSDHFYGFVTSLVTSGKS